MKVLMINGSPRAKGNTYTALHEMEKVFEAEGVETEIVHVGNRPIRGCIACNSCASKGQCVFDDTVNQAAPKFEECDGLVIASPVYYASANATLIAFLDRLFYSTPFDKSMKVGASVVAARRGGLSATFDELNKYFTISGMMAAVCRTGFAAILISLAVIYVPMASSQYLPLGIQKLLDLIPLVGSPADIFRTNVYHIFGKIVWSPYLLITVPFLLGIVCIPICIRKWAGPGKRKYNGTACSRTEDGL